LELKEYKKKDKSSSTDEKEKMFILDLQEILILKPTIDKLKLSETLKFEF
jgi:hypothetical protein